MESLQNFKNFFKPTYCKSIVTCLQFLNDTTLLAGDGNVLSIYDVKKLVKLAYKPVLPYGNIYGICHQKESMSTASNDCCLVVYGGCVLSLIRLTLIDKSYAIETIESSKYYHQMTDWIWDVCWTDSGQYLALILAHNRAILYDWNAQTTVQSVQCEEICILYSAHWICANNIVWDKLCVAVGTVFNQILIWKPSGEKNKEGRSKIIHRIQGHEGVIFSIYYDHQRQLLYSASDDRSVRIWHCKISADSVVDNIPFSANTVITQNQTLYGHSARVWFVRPFGENIVTASEDGSCCIWSHDGHIMQRLRGHQGRGVRSISVDETCNQLVTGGTDCSIRLWSIAPVQQLTTSDLNLCLTKGDFPRIVRLNNDFVVAMTNFGLLLKADLRNTDIKWELVIEDRAYSSYSLVEVCLPLNLVLLANSSGHIKVLFLMTNDVIEQQVYKSSKVFSALWLTSDNSEQGHFITCGPDGSMDLWRVDLSSRTFIMLHHFVLPPSNHRWATACAIIHAEHTLVVGDQRGSVYAYNLTQQDPVSQFHRLHGDHGVTNIIYHNDGYVYSCGRDGQYVQYDIVMPGELQLLFQHKVRTGFDWLMRLNFVGNELTVCGFHTGNLVVWNVDGNYPVVLVSCGGGHRSCDLKFDEQGGQFIFIQSRKIMKAVWTTATQQIILQEPLHGREITCITSLTVTNNIDSDMMITGGEDGLINIISFDDDENYHVNDRLQGHISSIRAVTVPQDIISTLNQGQLVYDASAFIQLSDNFPKSSDIIDNISCESTVSANDNRSIMDVKKTNCIPKNTVHIQTRVIAECEEVLKTLDDLSINTHSPMNLGCSYDKWNTNAILFSGGGRGQLCAWIVDAKHHRHKLLATYRPYRCDPDMRYMSIKALKISDNTYLVFAACSDGKIRIFTFSKAFRDFIRSNFHSRCVLVVNTFVSKMPSGEKKIFLISGATDGKLAVWNIDHLIGCALKNLSYNFTTSSKSLSADNIDTMSLAEPNLVLASHQSGINCLALQQFSENCLLVASGGDDGRVTLTSIDLHSLSSVDTLYYNGAHAAQITGIAFMGSNCIVTASIDQRLRLWNFIVSTKIEISLIQNIMTAITDIHGLLSHKKRGKHFVTVVGVGLQTLEFCFNKT